MAKNNQIDKPVAWRTLHYFYSEFKRRWVQYVLVFGTQALRGICTLFLPIIVADVVNKITTSEIAPDKLFTIFAPSLGWFIALLIIRTILAYATNILHRKTTLDSTVHIEEKCFSLVMSQSMSFFNNSFGGALVSQVGKFSGAFNNAIAIINYDIIPLIVNLLMAFIVLGSVVPWYTALVIVMLIIYIIISYKSITKTRPLNEAMATAMNGIRGHLADSFANVASVKSYANEATEQRTFHSKNRDYRKIAHKEYRASTNRIFASEVISAIIWVAMICFLIASVGSGTIMVGSVVLLITFTGNIVGGLWNFPTIFLELNRIFGDAYDMTKTLDEPLTVVDKPTAKELLVPHGEIKFDDVTFQYADGNEVVFDGLTITIRPGERVGFVGHSGSGKTTITKLLLRLADIDSGAILIDNQNIAQVTQESLRRCIAYVPQETNLFHRSIAENIAYGRPKAKKDEIIRAAKLANAWEFIEKLPNGLETMVGERGVKLSGGQRQRIAIARAILKDAPILVLDEATSALDTESERLIQAALKNLMRGRTAIVIAHRLSTVAELDRIIVLDNGKIIEDGPHADLVKSDGKYASLWNKQTGFDK